MTLRLTLIIIKFNPFNPSRFSYFNSLDKFISYRRDVWLVFIIVISELNANSVEPDQTPRSAMSDLGLQCLPMSLLWDARLIWAKDYE